MLDNPLLLEWHNAAAVFHDPVPTHIGLALLTHQLGYFDILPLYVVLMLMAPVFALIDRYAPQLVLPVSLALYLVALVVPAHTADLAGRRAMVLQSAGLAARVRARLRAGARGRRPRRLGAAPYRAGSASLALPIVICVCPDRAVRLWPDPTMVPQPHLFFLLDKTYVTPMRLIQFLALVAVFSVAFRYIRRFGDRRMRYRSTP